jgi:hypothetical protein
MAKTLRALVLIAATAWAAAASAQQSATPAITLELPVLPEAARHLDLLALPAYLALVLENNGLNPSLSSRVVVKDRTAFSIRAGTVRFVERKGSVFRYEGTVTIPLGLAEPGFTVPVDVDTSAIAQGKLVIRAYSGLSAVLPQALIERVEFKARALTGVESQRKVLAYLDRLAQEHRAKERGLEPILEAIIFEAYNRGGPAAAGAIDRGQPEALSDQALLLITVAIWLLGFPVFLWFVRSRRKLRPTP